MKRLIGLLITLVFFSGCLTAASPSKTQKSPSKAAQKARADHVFSELDGKSPTPYVTSPKHQKKAPLKHGIKPAPIHSQSPKTFTHETHLIARGYGQSKPEAIGQAKAELANMFESRIQSDISSVTRAVTDSVKGDSLKKTVQAKVRVVSSVELEGVQVGEVTRKSGEYVAVAALNRARAASKWQKEVDRIDAKIAVEEKGASKARGKLMQLRHLNNAVSFFLDKQAFSSRLRVIGYQASADNTITFEELAGRRQKIKSDFRIALDVNSAKGEELSHQLAKKLTSAGFIINERPSESDATLTIKLAFSKVKNNNPNFKFMRATADVSIVDSTTGKKVGHFNESQRSAHLNYDEAGVKAVKKLSKTLSKRIMTYLE